MTKEEAYQVIVKQRSSEWNAYREAHPNWIPDLSGLDLSDCSLVWPTSFNLSRANLCGAKLPKVNQSYEYGGRAVNMKGAIVDVSTEIPKGVDLSKYGAILVSQSELPKYRAASLTTVFISYAWANESAVLAIEQWIRMKGILRVMKDCAVILIFYSKESKDKPWPEFERELASDLEMSAKQEGRTPPRTIYVVVDDTPLPSVTESNRIAVMAKGKRFELVCEEIYHNILQIPKATERIDLDKWSDYVF